MNTIEAFTLDLLFGGGRICVRGAVYVYARFHRFDWTRMPPRKRPVLSPEELARWAKRRETERLLADVEQIMRNIRKEAR